MVFNLCQKSFNDRELAEEVTQDVFIKVYKNLDSFKQKSSTKTWVYTIALNTIKDVYKSKAYRDLKNTNCCDEYYERFEDVDAELKCKDFEAIHCLYNSVHQLPEKYKMVVILRYIDELSLKEISQITGDSLKSIEGRLTRAKAKLQEIIKAKQAVA